MAADKTYGPKVYRKQGGDVLVVADGGKIEIESGGELELQAGALADLADRILAAADIPLAEGSVLVGNAAGAAAAVAVSADATLAATGALTIANKAVTLAKMNDLAQDTLIGRATASTGVPEAIACTAAGRALLDDANAASQLVTLGLSATAAELNALAAAVGALGSANTYVKTDSGVKTLLAAHPTKTRGVLITVVINETFANGDTSQPVVKIGETDSDNKAVLVTDLVNAQAGDRRFFTMQNTATKAIIATLTAKAGTGTGGFTVLVQAYPNS